MTDLSYLAGFVDGEGHIGIKKESIRGRSTSHTYTERVSVAGTNKMSIETFQLIWPGHFYYHQPGKNSRAGYWSWELTGKKARDFLSIIRPHLLVKGLDADIVLALGKNKEKNNRKRIAPKDRELRDNLYSVLKAHRRVLWSK